MSRVSRAFAAFASTSLSSRSHSPWSTSWRAMSSARVEGKMWPSARALARALGVNARDITPEAKHGVITVEDVIRASAKPREGARTTEIGSRRTLMDDDFDGDGRGAQRSEDVELGAMRRAIARRLSESKRGIPHHYAEIEVELKDVDALRAEVLQKRGVKVSVNDCVMYASGRALREVPALNAGWDEVTKRIKAFASVDVCVAVAIEGGLMTPIVADVDTKTLTAIGAEVKALAKKAREGALKPHEFVGGSFAVSNLGMFGVDSFSAIINPPQGAILAVGSVVDKVILVNGAPATKKVMTVRVSADRRVADEADSARWLDAFANQFRSVERWVI